VPLSRNPAKSTLAGFFSQMSNKRAA